MHKPRSIRLYHFLHPMHSTRTVFSILAARLNRLVVSFRRQAQKIHRRFILPRLIDREVGLIRRGQRPQCWCGGALLPYTWNSAYGVCADCGCYVDRFPPLAHEFAKIYAFQSYWYTRQKIRGYPTIEQRAEYDRQEGRLARWLKVIERFGPAGGRVIEIGCAHSVLLVELKKRGYDCIGVEYEETAAQWARNHTGIDVRPGAFPGIALPPCDIFMAFDVLEHVMQPEEFLREASRLLNPKGIAIIQTPIDPGNGEPPFADLFDLLFDHLEHLVIFSRPGIRKLAELSGLEIIGEAVGTIGVDIVVLQKKE